MKTGVRLLGKSRRNRNLGCVFGMAGLLLLPSLADAADLERSLTLHLPLTTDLRDHSAARHPVEVVGTVRIEPEGAYFGGRMDWLEVPHIALDGREFSVAVWIREMTLERHVGLLEQFDRNRPGHHLHLMLRENRQPYFGFYIRDVISPAGVPRAQEWMHLVFQYKDGSQQIWINGHLMASATAEPYLGSNGVTAIGKAPRWSNVPARDFKGYMRDFRIYQRALEVGEIAALAGAGRDRDVESPPGQTAGAANSLQRDNPLAAPLADMLPTDPARPFLEIDGRRVIVNGRPGQVYLLQGTSDFVTWTPLKWFTNETGRAIYIESAEAPAVRFYRVVVEPATSVGIAVDEE